MQTPILGAPKAPYHSPGPRFAHTTSAIQTGRKDSLTHGGMGKDNLKPVDFAGSQWVQAGVHSPAAPVSQTSVSGDGTPSSTCLRRDREIAGEGCNPGGERRYTGGFLLQGIPSSQEGRPSASSVKPPSTESILESQSLQDGGYACSEGSAAKERLDDKNRSERRIFLCSHSSSTSEVPEVQVARKMFPIHLPSIWSGVSPASLHKDFETNSGVLAEQRDKVCHLPRRPAPSTPEQGHFEGAHSNSLGSARSTGVSSELSKVHARSKPDHGFSRLHNQLYKEGTESSNRESREDCGRSEGDVGLSYSVSPLTCPTDWEDDCSSPSCPPSSFALSESAASQACSLEEKGLRWPGNHIPRSSQGPAVVGRESVYMEWESNPGPQPQHGNRDRCLKKGMGSLLSRCPDRRLLECAGGEVAHKLLGNAGSILCNQSLCEGEAASFDSAAYRQHVSSGPCQSDGRNKVPITCVSSDRSLVVVPTEAHHHYSAAHSRAGECHSRLLVKTPEGQDGLGVGAQHFQMCEPSSWSPSGRSFCNSVFKAASSFLQLEARPRGRGYRCLCTELVQIPGFCAPSVVPDFTGSSESPFRPSISGADHSSLVHTGVVPYLDGVTSGLSHPTSPGSRCDSSISQLRLPNSGGTSPVGRLEGLRQRFREKKISDQAVDLILSSWRDKTNANYNSAWKAWESWCSARGIYPFASDISYVLDFLADKYTAGLKYRSLNCYRSALSSVLLPVEGFQVGQHPLVARLLRGVFNCRPPQPRYSQTWEVSQVLSYIKSLGPNEELSLKLISRKLVVLLALVLAHRCSDLGRLTLQGRKYSAEGAVLRCTGLAKQARPGKEESLRPAVISHFLEDALLCPVLCLKAYERATASFRKKDSMQLFLAINSPHQPVTTSTVARWLKQAIVVSGIEPEFTAHSTRGASSTAAAMNGITIREVMERAGWSRQDTFCKHYFRPTEQALVAAEYGRSILEQSTNMHRTC